MSDSTTHLRTTDGHTFHILNGHVDPDEAIKAARRFLLAQMERDRAALRLLDDGPFEVIHARGVYRLKYVRVVREVKERGDAVPRWVNLTFLAAIFVVLGIVVYNVAAS